MSRKNSSSSSELFEEKQNFKARRCSSMDLTPMRLPAGTVKHSISVDDINTSPEDLMLTPEKSKLKKRSIRDYMVPKTPTSSGDAVYDQVKTTRNQVSEALDKLLHEKSQNDEIDELERQLWKQIRCNDQKALKFESLDSDDAPSDIETEKFNFTLPKHHERSIFQELTSKPVFKQSNMFTEFCSHSVLDEICELMRLPTQKYSNPNILQNMLAMGLLRCPRKKGRLTQLLLKLYSVTVDDELLISLPEMLTRESGGKPQGTLDVRTWQKIFSNFGFVDGFYEAETERTYSCLFCEHGAVTQELLFLKLSFIVTYLVDHADQLKSTLNDDVISKFMRLFVLLLQTERHVTVTSVLRRALEKLTDLARDWARVKYTLVKDIIDSVTDCKGLEIIVDSLPINSQRCDELTKATAFFAIHKILGLPYEVELVSGDMDIVNFHSAASLTSCFTLQKLRSVKPFGVAVNLADVIYSCVYLLQICIGNLPIMPVHRPALCAISNALLDLNHSIRTNAVLETLEVKHLIKLVTTTLGFQLNFAPTQLTSSNTIFKHLREAAVVEELVYDGNNNGFNTILSDSDSDEAMDVDTSTVSSVEKRVTRVMPSSGGDDNQTMKIEPESRSPMHAETETISSLDRDNSSFSSILNDVDNMEYDESILLETSSSGDNIFEKMQKHMKESNLKATTLNFTATLIPKDYFT